ncbi:MAG TPA: hypothetical protein VM099_08335 [Gemmatimonadaceae bacterium]|nr:hypothetical protein [Gemmatimonadaceae bacterium]
MVIYLAVLAALYTSIAVSWFVIPIAGRFGKVFLGTSIFAPDTFLNAGILEWGYRALLSPKLRLFDWPAGFPLSNSLATTENLIGWQVLYTPLRTAGVSIAVAYNILLLTSLVLSAIGAALLARRFVGSKSAGAVAGLVFGFAPFHLEHLLHLQTMAVCWAPFAILFLDRYLELRRPADAVGLAVMFLMSSLCSIYFGVFLAIVLPLYVILCWIFKRYPFDSRSLLGLVATGAVSVAFLMPVISHYIEFNRNVGYHHTAQALANFSMEAAAIFRMPDWMASWSWTRLARVSDYRSTLSFSAAFPGIVALGLAIFGAIRGIRDSRYRRATLVLLTLAILCYLLALGPILRPINLNELRGASWLPMPGKLWLLIPGLRWPMRIFFFALLAFSILCGFGLSFLRQNVSARSQRALVFLAVALITVESWPRLWLSQESVIAPDPMSLSDAYPVLAKEQDRGGVIELPVSDQSGWRTPYLTRYTYASSAHLRRVVAIHGSVTPPLTHTLLKAAIAAPDTTAMHYLASRGVTRLVIHLPLMRGTQGMWLVHKLQAAGYPVIFAGNEGVIFSTTRTPAGTVYAH